jgi:membrane-associated phospholipid phosphatase
VSTVHATKEAKWITGRFILALVLFIVVLFVFVGITDEIVLEHNNVFDQHVSNAIGSLVSPLTTRLMLVVTFFGSANFLLPAYLVLIVYYLLRKKKRRALDIAMVGLTSTGILFLLKDIFQRQRPLDPLIRNVTGFSYPSGHSFSSFTFFGLIIYMAWRSNASQPVKIVCSVLLFLLATVIAFSRVYLRVHYPSDVVAGFCLSIVWLMLSLWILHKADRKAAPVINSTQ